MDSHTLSLTEKLEKIVAAIPAELGVDTPDPIVSVSLVALRLAAGMTVLTMTAENSVHIDAQLAALVAQLKTCVEREPNPRVRELLHSALENCKAAYFVKTGELQNNLIH